MMDRDEILRKLGVCRLGIFGSYARGEPKEASDMDFLVKFEQATFHSYFDLKFFLKDLFGRTVDLVIADTIKPRIRCTILEETIYAEGLLASGKPCKRPEANYSMCSTHHFAVVGVGS